MKMLNNVHGADVFATSRTPIQSPRSTKMGEGDLLCAARPPERPAQVHRHHAEDGAAAVAEHADGVDPREQKRYKNSVLPPTVLVPCVANVEALCVANVEAPNANASRPDDNHVDVG